MALGRQDSTQKLLKQVVEQLQQQTEELKHIRRSSRTTNQILAAIHHLVQQVLHVLHSISHACSTLAAAANNYLASIAAAQQAARLHATLSSGRLIMLLVMALQALLNIRTVFSRQCLGSASNPWLGHGLGSVQKAVSSFAGLFGAKQQLQQASMLWALVAPARSGRCMVFFTGRYGLGMLGLLVWLIWSWRQQQRCNTLSTAGHSMQAVSGPWTQASPGPLDPVISLLLTAVPINSRSSSSSVLASWAGVLQAALYEGLLGCLLLKMLGGRWWLWLLLWEGWLAWLAGSFLATTISTTTGSKDGSGNLSSQKGDVSNSSGRKRLGQAPCTTSSRKRFWADMLPLPHPGSTATAADGCGAVAAGTASTRETSSRGAGSVVDVLMPRVIVAVLHLGVPIVLAGAGLWL